MKVEFKVKEEGKSWEETQVLITLDLNSRAEIFDTAIRLYRVFEKKVRWNFEGLSQGHYVEERK
jgi:hypothetical protein